jgi:hypothetical protein
MAYALNKFATKNISIMGAYAIRPYPKPLITTQQPDKKINFVKTCRNIHFGTIFDV